MVNFILFYLTREVLHKALKKWAEKKGLYVMLSQRRALLLQTCQITNTFLLCFYLVHWIWIFRSLKKPDKPDITKLLTGTAPPPPCLRMLFISVGLTSCNSISIWKKPSGVQWSCCYLWRATACLQEPDWMQRFTLYPSEFPVVEVVQSDIFVLVVVQFPLPIK